MGWEGTFFGSFIFGLKAQHKYHEQYKFPKFQSVCCKSWQYLYLKEK